MLGNAGMCHHVVDEKTTKEIPSAMLNLKEVMCFSFDVLALQDIRCYLYLSIITSLCVQWGYLNALLKCILTIFWTRRQTYTMIIIHSSPRVKRFRCRIKTQYGLTVRNISRFYVASQWNGTTDFKIDLPKLNKILYTSR